MTEYSVHMTSFQSATMRVQADDPDDAIDEALTEGVPGICWQCSGWGQNWSRDCDDDEWTAYSVTDKAGTDVWTGPSSIDGVLIRELDGVRAELDRDPSNAIKWIDARIERLSSGAP